MYYYHKIKSCGTEMVSNDDWYYILCGRKSTNKFLSPYFELSVLTNQKWNHFVLNIGKLILKISKNKTSKMHTSVVESEPKAGIFVLISKYQIIWELYNKEIPKIYLASNYLPFS